MSDLPPLPDFVGLLAREGGFRQEPWVSNEPAYTADQMREYALAAVAAEREACARLIERYPEWVGPKAKEEIAAAIRARYNRSRVKRTCA